MNYTIRRIEKETHGYVEPELKTGNALPLQMLLIPSGEFIMGSPINEQESSEDEQPQHQVTVPNFYMGRYLVTQAQWRAVSQLPVVNSNIELPADPSDFFGTNHPVEQIDWYQAHEFCQRLRQATGRPYRLPSEAEWEYACRAITPEEVLTVQGRLTIRRWNEQFCKPFFLGQTLTDEVANYNAHQTYGDGNQGEYRNTTTSVDHFKIANAFGLSDMHGNVREWCADHWSDNYEGAPTDGSAWLTDDDSNYRVVRGGSWFDYPWDCRSAYRLYCMPSKRSPYIGFRVACSISS
ncbi:MAG: formylglycine-generating enzyme family protein [Spirulina sp. SIO3F2]|nr:formylglycine-generating enzyme family protein [Spirulina sp. SIO3F2]